MVTVRLQAFIWFLIAGAVPLFAQTPPQQTSPQEQPSASDPAAILARIKIDRAGGVHVSKLFSVVFGGIKQGSSVAAGPAISHDFANGAFVQLKGVYSVRHFKLLQARFDSPTILSKRAMFSTRLRWQDAPVLRLYQSGPDSPNVYDEYGEKRTEVSGFLRVGVAPHLTVTGGTAGERYRLADFQDPALAEHPWYLHSTAAASYDTRFSPDYSRTGTVLEAAVHHYHQFNDGRASFRGFEVGVGQLIPTVRTGQAPTDWKGALALSARAWLSETGEGSSVPFNLMPTLGGGTYLRAFPGYRFRDRDALLLRAEYRWAVHSMIDVAALYEGGSVAPRVSGLGWNSMARSVGGGLRVHSKTSGLLRVDLCRGREGTEFSIGFGLAGA